MIVIGDPHGNYKTLLALLDKIPQEEKDKGVVIAGDLMDRGPGSKQVIQYCIDNKILVVLGNHEQMMIDELEWALIAFDEIGYLSKQGLWVLNGGYQTLESYTFTSYDLVDDRGIPKLQIDKELLRKHVEYLKTLPVYLEFKDIENNSGRHLVVSHSLINNLWHLRNEGGNSARIFKEQVLWNRNFHKIKIVPGIYNVIGHTPQPNGPRIRKTYACIDTGCFYNEIGFFKLTALQFPEMIIYDQNNIDMPDNRHLNYPHFPKDRA
jgi:serine/threonine protein phosphatase 1